VKKQVFATSSVDESKSLIGDSFDRTLCHLFIPKRCLVAEPKNSVPSVLDYCGKVYRPEAVLAMQAADSVWHFSISKRVDPANRCEIGSERSFMKTFGKQTIRAVVSNFSVIARIRAVIRH